MADYALTPDELRALAARHPESTIASDMAGESADDYARRLASRGAPAADPNYVEGYEPPSQRAPAGSNVRPIPGTPGVAGTPLPPATIDQRLSQLALDTERNANPNLGQTLRNQPAPAPIDPRLAAQPAAPQTIAQTAPRSAPTPLGVVRNPNVAPGILSEAGDKFVRSGAGANGVNGPNPSLPPGGAPPAAAGAAAAAPGAAPAGAAAAPAAEAAPNGFQRFMANANQTARAALPPTDGYMGKIANVAKQGGSWALRRVGPYVAPALETLGVAKVYADPQSTAGDVAQQTIEGVARVAGGVVGAGLGGAAGTAVAPGPGTAVGAVAGGVGGYEGVDQLIRAGKRLVGVDDKTPLERVNERKAAADAKAKPAAPAAATAAATPAPAAPATNPDNPTGNMPFTTDHLDAQGKAHVRALLTALADPKLSEVDRGHLENLLVAANNPTKNYAISTQIAPGGTVAGVAKTAAKATPSEATNQAVAAGANPYAEGNVEVIRPGYIRNVAAPENGYQEVPLDQYRNTIAGVVMPEAIARSGDPKQQAQYIADAQAGAMRHADPTTSQLELERAKGEHVVEAAQATAAGHVKGQEIQSEGQKAVEASRAEAAKKQVITLNEESTAADGSVTKRQRAYHFDPATGAMKEIAIAGETPLPPGLAVGAPYKGADGTYDVPNTTKTVTVKGGKVVSIQSKK